MFKHIPIRIVYWIWLKEYQLTNAERIFTFWLDECLELVDCSLGMCFIIFSSPCRKCHTKGIWHEQVSCSDQTMLTLLEHLVTLSSFLSLDNVCHQVLFHLFCLVFCIFCSCVWYFLTLIIPLSHMNRCYAQSKWCSLFQITPCNVSSLEEVVSSAFILSVLSSFLDYWFEKQRYYGIP